MEWFKSKYWYDGTNNRFPTFEMTLNLLRERFEQPVIIETGCQRLEDDLGAGMSTSIFAEYISKETAKGQLFVVDNNQEHLDTAKKCTEKWQNPNISFHCSDSVAFLEGFKGFCSLLYLDSYDYPIGDIWAANGGKVDLEKAMKIVADKEHEELMSEFGHLIIPCQEHCLNEFKAIESKLYETAIVLIDDNNFPGGGKPGLLKPYLLDKGWTCVLDNQQTLWIRV